MKEVQFWLGYCVPSASWCVCWFDTVLSYHDSRRDAVAELRAISALSIERNRYTANLEGWER